MSSQSNEHTLVHKAEIQKRTAKLGELRLQLKDCNLCTARGEASQPVCPSGPVLSKLMVVGRNPGTTEDMSGIPFNPVAPGGGELTWYLEQAGLNRDRIFITNCLNCHTWMDREPTDEEVNLCTNVFLKAFIRVMKPILIIAAGKIAVRFFLPYIESLMRDHSRPHKTQYGVVWPIPHPAVICYNERKRPIFESSAQALGNLVRAYHEKFGTLSSVFK